MALSFSTGLFIHLSPENKTLVVLLLLSANSPHCLCKPSQSVSLLTSTSLTVLSYYLRWCVKEDDGQQMISSTVTKFDLSTFLRHPIVASNQSGKEI